MTFTPLGCIDPISVEETEKLEIAVFPNPAKEQLTISTDKPLHNLRIFSISGRLITNKNNLTGANYGQVNISNLQPGVYLLQAESSKGFKTIRFVKE